MTAIPPNNSIPINNKRIGAGFPCYIIAEAGSNHNRDINIAMKLIDAAKNARADAVKFQIFSADTIVTKADIPLTRIDFAGEKSTHELFKKIELPREWLSDLNAYAGENGITFLCTPFDEKAVDEMEKINAAAYKIASFEINHFPLLRYVASTKKPVLLSTGMATIGEIEEALDVLYDTGCENIALFHCGIGYPMNPSEVNLMAMNTMSAVFNHPVGYSDHTMGLTVPIAAVARGACCIEKHMTLDRGLKGPDHPFAMEPDELQEMVESIRMVEAALGTRLKGPTESEKEYKERGRRSLYAGVDIEKGRKIEAEMLCVLRPNAGLHPRYIEIVSGRYAARDIKKYEPITWDCI